MTLIQAILLGIIEGITEFLPISSTAHLIVAQKLMGIPEINEFFTVVVQLGAIAGLIWAERVKLLEICQEFIQKAQGNKKVEIRNTKAFALGIATIPVLVIGFLVKDSISSLQNNLSLIAFMSIVIGLVLYAAEWYSKKNSKNYHLSSITYQLFLMGLFQCISLIPGTSRSGITAAGGAFQKMSLSQALEYSFLLSIPALLAAGGYEMLKLMSHPIDSTIVLPTLIGTGVSFLCAIGSIRWLRTVVRQKGFTPFILYRFAFAAVILLLL